MSASISRCVMPKKVFYEFFYRRVAHFPGDAILLHRLIVIFDHGKQIDFTHHQFGKSEAQI